jgi:hypothetical protein
MSVDTQAIDNTSGKPLPTVEQFKEVVNAQLHYWSEANIEGLCYSQTSTVINNLVEYYGDPASNTTCRPEVDTFKEVVRDFREKKEREAFSEFTDPEVQELITLLAPHFHEPPKDEDEDEEETTGTE